VHAAMTTVTDYSGNICKTIIASLLQCILRKTSGAQLVHSLVHRNIQGME